MQWGLTGTPGTGKTSVASELPGHVVHLADLMEDSTFRAGTDETRDTVIADLDALRAWFEDQPEDTLVESHLAHRLPVDRVIVLRCHPDELARRLRSREGAIPTGKIEENVEAERLDIVLAEAVERHGADAVAEIDTTDRTPVEVAERVQAVRDGTLRAPPGELDFLEEHDAR